MATIEGICNEALDLVGYKRHIGSVWEGTVAATIALNVWGSTRDSLLEAMSPEWAIKDSVLTLLKSAPADQYQSIAWTSAYPPLPWLYEYEYPTDCLRPLQIKARQLSLPVWRPRPVVFRLANDAATGARVLVANEPAAILTYTSVVKDPNIWTDTFITAMVQALAQAFKSLVPSGATMRRQEPENANQA